MLINLDYLTPAADVVFTRQDTPWLDTACPGGCLPGGHTFERRVQIVLFGKLKPAPVTTQLLCQYYFPQHAPVNIVLVLAVLADKTLHPGEGFFDIRHRGGIAAADISLTTFSKGRTGYSGHFFFRKQCLSKIL